jgi:hypothetical protein
LKAIVAVFADGARHTLFVRDAGFNTQSWAETRRTSFRLLGVVKIEEHLA